MAQFLRPDSDVANTWTNGFAAIDEATASDADFVYSGNNPNGSGAEFGLSNPTGTPQSGTCTVRYREIQLRDTTPNSSGTAVNLDIQVLEGSTLIASSGVHTLAIATWRAGSFTFATSAVTNWSDLRIKFVATGGGGSPSNRRGAGVSWAEIETPDASVAITGSMAAVEAGSDTFAASGVVTDPAITGNLAANEAGSDSLGGSGAVTVSGALSGLETGADSISASGTVDIFGAVSITETGSDVANAIGQVPVAGGLAATETGGDTFASSGTVTDSGIVGSLSGVESGGDSFAGSGTVPIAGTLSVTETGSDSASFAGNAVVTGSGAIAEAGNDNFAASGTVSGDGPVTGTLAAVESAGDAFAASGVVTASGIIGSLSAVETGSDSASFAGVAIATQKEVFWPGTRIPRKEYERRQRSILVRVLQDQYEEELKRRKGDKKKRVSRNNVSQKAEKAIEAIKSEGIISLEAINAIEGQIEKSIGIGISVAEINALIAKIASEFKLDVETQRKIDQEKAYLAALEDEYAAIALLLAA